MINWTEEESEGEEHFKYEIIVSPLWTEAKGL